ncbi:hypothetical protein WN55_07184 [Dufourea novaeangliae]|uniref:Uncharacterized protein n=1 Tax=Dufourea novaeangliae TaxID=178035 RepID=A0A154P4F5_DUFNO|nr:hypothetical protein WN55_07184 [Dufourea novaeangliae]
MSNDVVGQNQHSRTSDSVCDRVSIESFEGKACSVEKCSLTGFCCCVVLSATIKSCTTFFTAFQKLIEKRQNK